MITNSGETILLKKAFGIFSFLRTHRQTKEGVTTVWGINTGNAINGFTIFKTYDDPTDPYANWNPVGYVPFTGLQNYKFTDYQVFPGFISYRVVASLANGTTESSVISTEHILQH
jgi:hypothetical protein